ncbi:response regulator [Mariniblastus fucicola]|uniref:Oxygen regulatory protein NreC n=1 Tax=Mariniblastus fucicola TaxID=980251 RepID=A0A5B9PJK5_9BACT|nr:response regulator transcription factor [Mariniblastus fucicola]QEG22841.1 Oxygen regulatory protein NreC [Mariniblastus fucicola]
MKLVLADDHTMVRESLARVLDSCPSVSVVEQAGDGIELKKVIEKTKPEFVIMDYSMPNHQAVDAIGDFLSTYPKMKIVVLTVHENIHYAVRVLNAGAHGYLIKAAAVDELLGAIEAVKHGNVYVSRKIADKVWQQLRAGKDGKTGLGSLSTRELEVLKLLAEGHSLQESANELGIKVSTVSTYRSRIMEKLSLKSNGELLRFAIDNQIIT